MSAMLAIARLELARLLRARTSFTLLLLVPALQVILFGYAIQPQATQISVAIAAPTPQNAEVVAQRLRTEAGITVISSELPPGGAEAAVRAGKAMIGIEAPETASFSNPFAPRVPLRIIIDSASGTAADAAASRIATRYWQTVAARADEGPPAPDLRIQRLFNPDARADWTFLPALIGVTVMISMILLGCLSLAREREAGTWETLLSLPIGRGQLLLGKALPYAVLGTVQGISVLVAGMLLFDMPSHGPVWALVALLPVFATAHFFLGYALSARARTQIEALQSAIAFYLPAMLLSGFLYPFETLPRWAQVIGSAFPLTHFIRASRDVLLRGRGLDVLAGHALPILAFLIVLGVIGIQLQSRKLD